MEDAKYQLLTSPLLRVLDLLIQKNEEMSDAEVTAAIKGARRAAIHQSLVKLNRMGITKRTHHGRRCYSKINSQLPWITFFKITSNLLTLSPLVEQLAQHATKVILFGSRAQGTNRSDSDFDLLVVSSNHENILSIVDGVPLDQHIQLLLKTPEEMIGLESEEPVLSTNIQQGIVLWEK